MSPPLPLDSHPHRCLPQPPASRHPHQVVVRVLLPHGRSAGRPIPRVGAEALGLPVDYPQCGPQLRRVQRGWLMTTSIGGKYLHEKTLTGPFLVRGVPGRARFMPRYQHCLSEHHSSTGCPQNPNPMLAASPGPILPGLQQQGSTNTLPTPSSAQLSVAEICCNYNAGRCRFSKCRFVRSCVDCLGPHAAINCPCRLAPSRLPGAFHFPRGIVATLPTRHHPRHPGTLPRTPNSIYTHVLAIPRGLPPDRLSDYSSIVIIMSHLIL